MKYTNSKTQWAKIGQISRVTFVGKDVLCLGAGCHLIFVNLLSGTEKIYTANNEDAGDGIQCFTGHRSLAFFAFTENCLDPAIFMKTYPEFEHVCVLRGGPSEGNINMAFSESSLLITLGNIPDFVMTVWNWKTQQKLAAKETSVLLEAQALRCNLSSPIYVAQLGIGTSDLYIWDIQKCGGICIVTEHKTHSPYHKTAKFTSILWTSEGGLLVSDSCGCVYQMYPDHSLERIIELSDAGNIYSAICWYKSGLAISGPNDEIRHYKKSGTWTVDWTMEPPEPLQNLAAGRGDYLIAVSRNFNILRVLQQQGEFMDIKQNESSFVDFGLVHPTEEYLVALCGYNVINVFEVSTGKTVGHMVLSGNALTLKENPQFPYVSIGYESGVLELISIYDPAKPSVMTSLYLSKNPVQGIYFNECGRIIVTANLTIGQFFILEGSPGGRFKVLITLTTSHQVVDYTLVISKDCYRLFTIPVTSDKYIAGNVIKRYCIIDGKSTEKIYSFEDSGVLYSKLCASSKINRDRILYAVPLRSKMIHEIEVKRGATQGTINRKINTGHQMRQINICTSRSSALTWAYDGFVILRDPNLDEALAVVLPHHRILGGVKKAQVNSYQSYIVSLGKENVLVCTNLVDNEIDEDAKGEQENLLSSSTYNLLFTRKTYGFFADGALKGKTWLEIADHVRTEKERVQCEKERSSILKEFALIQKELAELMTKNLEGIERERLDISEFNLDPRVYEGKVERSRNLRSATERYLKDLIVSYNKISNWLIETCWKTMHVQGTMIHALFEDFNVWNFALLPDDLNHAAMVEWIRKHKDLEEYLNMTPFKPWKVTEESELEVLLGTRPSAIEHDEFAFTTHAAEEEDAYLEDELRMSGADTRRFVDPKLREYLQQEVQTYFQAEMQALISKKNSCLLREHFNKEFDGTMASKVREVHNMKERNSRLRHIVSEINYFSVDKLDIEVIDPEWRQEEQPELIIQVKNDEVPVTPYISPSEQSLLNAQAAEAERIRLLLLEDDFKERALMAMMNGVLEVRWEDELRKEVPLPKCMLQGKSPEGYNEDDIRAVRDYEEKVKFLHSERERYKKLLEVEYGKIGNTIKESIRKFNGRLEDLLLIKLKIDSAIGQEMLKIARIRLNSWKLERFKDKQLQVLSDIKNKEEVIRGIHGMISALHEATSECKNYSETVQAKEKFLEKAYKKDFQDMSLVVQEQAIKLYRKRPKVGYRSITSAIDLHELARCVISQERPLTLAPDCLEFLKALEALDSQVGVPPTIDDATYNLICKHRRLKIEHEVKVKATLVDISQAEATTALFQKKLSQNKELNVQNVAELAKLRTDLTDMIHNMEIQIVMPKGLVEVPLTGSIKDFEDSVLVWRQDVENINKLILEKGNKKLQSMQQMMTFRRGILSREWEHKRMNMQIADLNEKIADIRSVKVTKEIQQYLKTIERDGTENIVPFDTEVDILKATYENTIKERKEIVKKLKKQIKAVKDGTSHTEKNIHDINLDVCDFQLQKDHDLDSQEGEVIQARMKTLLRRTKLANLIQENHNEILVAQTELELLRLKTFPTLKYKLLS